VFFNPRKFNSQVETGGLTGDQGHEVPIHGEINTIAGGFSGEGVPPPSARSRPGE